jgi:ABC-type antimicrobial peptide transport system permease subunit
VRTMEEVAAQSMAQPRFRAQLVGTFGALALAAVGIFGVLAFSVSRRTREFGIRMALGARSADVLRMVAGSGLRIALTGIAIGLAGAAALTHLLAALLYGEARRSGDVPGRAAGARGGGFSGLRGACLAREPCRPGSGAAPGVGNGSLKLLLHPKDNIAQASLRGPCRWWATAGGFALSLAHLLRHPIVAHGSTRECNPSSYLLMYRLPS